VIETGPQGVQRVETGRSKDTQDNGDAPADDDSFHGDALTLPLCAKKPGPRPEVDIPFVRSRSCTAYDSEAPWWYVVTRGKVVGVFCNRYVQISCHSF
jgi:hypothetical protein